MHMALLPFSGYVAAYMRRAAPRRLDIVDSLHHHCIFICTLPHALLLVSYKNADEKSEKCNVLYIRITHAGGAMTVVLVVDALVAASAKWSQKYCVQYARESGIKARAQTLCMDMYTYVNYAYAV